MSQLKWSQIQDIRDRTNGTILLPVGSTEQHGKHLPVGTDSLLAMALADNASKISEVLIAPPMRFGWSPHHLALPGTISVKAENLIECTYDMVESLSQHAFTHYVFLHGHRIVNIPWLQIVAERCQRQLGVNVNIFDPAYASKSLVEEMGFEKIGHAESIETSHMLYCYPELVDLQSAEDFLPEDSRYYNIDPSDPADTLCYVPSTKENMSREVEKSGGSKGKPTESSAEKGEKYHNHLVSILVEILQSLKEDGKLPG